MNLKIALLDPEAAIPRTVNLNIIEQLLNEHIRLDIVRQSNSAARALFDDELAEAFFADDGAASFAIVRNFRQARTHNTFDCINLQLLLMLIIFKAIECVLGVGESVLVLILNLHIPLIVVFIEIIALKIRKLRNILNLKPLRRVWDQGMNWRLRYQ